MSDSISSDPRFYADLDVLGFVHLFHRLPSFEQVSTDAIAPNNDAGFEDAFPQASSCIKKIHMGHVSFPSTVIAALIRMPKALEEFTCTTGGRASFGDGPYLVFPETVGRALWCQRSSLMKLDLDLDQHITHPYSIAMEWGGDENSDDKSESEDSIVGSVRRSEAESVKTSNLSTGRDYNSTIGSLHDFDRLSYLSIGIQLLLGPRQYGLNAVGNTPFRLVEALPR